ncbi:type VI secretion system protein TssA [Pseudoduganella sp. LjRoot289]|uniref:type VI secretion system protein TssA n=1 Tax=Pseudoduganella sp. LjRoot289 TaxID=3342314 RepID=UPI003ECDE0A2
MFSIAQLLTPISTAQVCGEDISFSSEVDEIVKARLADDPTLAQGEWVVALKEADWPLVATRCAALIESRSKDLRLAVWLAEAHAKTRSFRGLGDGFALLAGLCSKYWDGLHPAIEDGDIEQRVGNLYWLLSRTPQLVKEIPVTEDGAVSMASFEAARQRMNAASAAALNTRGWDMQPVAASGPGLAELDAERRRNSAQFNDSLLADARYCAASLLELERAVDAQLGADGPSFGAAREALLNAIDFIEPLASPPGPEESAAFGDDGPLAEGGTGAGARRAAAGPPQNRTQALAQLRLVAEFFRRTEPHSPVAYLAEKAAGWGELPLHLWLRAVLKEPGVIAQMDELLGTAPASE